MNKRLALALSTMLAFSSVLSCTFAESPLAGTGETISGDSLNQDITVTSGGAISIFDDLDPKKEFEKFIKLSDKNTRMPQFMIGDITAPTGAGADKAIEEFFNENQSEFDVQTAKDDFFNNFFETTMSFEDELGLTVVRTQQEIDGMPVLGYDQVITVDSEGVVKSMSGHILPAIDKVEKALDKKMKVSSSEAIDLAETDLGFTPNYQNEPTAEEVVYMDGKKPIAAYKVNLNFLDPEPGNWIYIINGKKGSIIEKYNKIHANGPEIGSGTDFHGNKHTFNTYSVDSSWGKEYALFDSTRGNGILIYDGRNRKSLPGTIWYDADNKFNDDYDAVAVDALVNSTFAYDYYKDIHNRNSFDNMGARIKSTVHYQRDYENAFWNGYQLVYGDGYGAGGDYHPLAAALDVVGHELTHAVTEKTANLEYLNESGAINEAMSDIFGTLIEFYADDDPDWLCGEDIVTSSHGGTCMRSLKDPTEASNGLTGPYPDHLSKKYTGSLDNGGVHINSSIVNKCAYLISEGGSHYGVQVNGIGREKMGKIFYRALTVHMTSRTDFAQLRQAVIYSATELYGAGSSAVSAVEDAFSAVGIN